jgi:hypothetical protein
LAKVTSYAEITSDPATKQAIAAVYPNINTIDPLVGALAEDYLPGASVGPLVAAAVRLQFDRLRDGDRFWYDNDTDFTASEIAALHQLHLSDIIRRNSGITNLQTNVFFVIPEPNTLTLCGILLTVAGAWASANSHRKKLPLAKNSWLKSSTKSVMLVPLDS